MPPTASARPTASPRPSSSGAARAPAPSSSTSRAAFEVRHESGFVPQRVEIPGIRIVAQVDPVSVGADGVLGIPDHPTVLGWWTGGAMPGAGRGTVVVDGHLDSRRYGTGPLVRLGQLRPGDRAVVSAGEQRREYAVSGLRVYRKTTLPYAQIFAQDVPERLVIVTCGGSYSRAHGWDSNVVVYLEPVR